MENPQRPLLLEPQALLQKPRRPEMLIVDVRSTKQYNQGHIPGAVSLSPAQLISAQPPIAGKLPAAAKLQALAATLGLTPETLVVAYDAEGGGWAGRLIWTLDMIGHYQSAYLNGGLPAWLGSGLALSTDSPMPRAASHYPIKLQPQHRIELTELQATLSDLTIWDARTVEEYCGDQTTALRNGHMPGAIHLEWLTLMDHNNHLKLRPGLQPFLAKHGLTADKPIVTHCHSHHRSGLTYLAGRLLGYLNIRAYDGSWSEWGNQTNTPVVTGMEPG